MLTEGMSDQELIAYLTAKLAECEKDRDAWKVKWFEDTTEDAKIFNQHHEEMLEKLAECQAREAKLRELVLVGRQRG